MFILYEWENKHAHYIIPRRGLHRDALFSVRLILKKHTTMHSEPSSCIVRGHCLGNVFVRDCFDFPGIIVVFHAFSDETSSTKSLQSIRRVLNAMPFVKRPSVLAVAAAGVEVPAW